MKFLKFTNDDVEVYIDPYKVTGVTTDPDGEDDGVGACIYVVGDPDPFYVDESEAEVVVAIEAATIPQSNPAGDQVQKLIGDLFSKIRAKQ